MRKAPSPIHGFGCFARIGFQAGDRIGSYEGPEVQEDGTYVLWVYDAEAQVLTAREGRNLLRWLNHSAHPNAEFDAFESLPGARSNPGRRSPSTTRVPPPRPILPPVVDPPRHTRANPVPRARRLGPRIRPLGLDWRKN